MTKDFEALGRYVDASERVDRLNVRRHNLAGELSRLLGKAFIVTDAAVSAFDHCALLKLAEELADVNAQLEAAIADMGRHAAAAGRPAMRRV
jgi:acyl-homoserine lactone acylase PvdQ